MRYARCNICKKFYIMSYLDKAQCPACVYTAYRCEGCGGKGAILRSLRMHFAYFKTRGKGAGGHEERVQSILKRAANEIAAKILRR